LPIKSLSCAGLISYDLAFRYYRHDLERHQTELTFLKAGFGFAMAPINSAAAVSDGLQMRVRGICY